MLLNYLNNSHENQGRPSISMNSISNQGTSIYNMYAISLCKPLNSKMVRECFKNQNNHHITSIKSKECIALVFIHDNKNRINRTIYMTIMMRVKSINKNERIKERSQNHA